MTDYIPRRDRVKGLAALTALEDSGKLFCYPADVARVIDKDHKTVYAAPGAGRDPSHPHRPALPHLRRLAAPPGRWDR